MKNKISKLILAGLISLNGVAFAAEDTLPAFDLEELVVVGKTMGSVIPKDTITTKYVSPGKAASIPELLRNTTSIDIQRRASYGDNQDNTVKVRGFDARRYTVLLDGRQINSAGVMGGKYIDWNTIPLETVEKIQIIKGGKSAAYGNTLGGVINIVTKDKPEGGSASVLLGQDGRHEYRVNYAGQKDKLNMQVLANYSDANAYLRNNDYDNYQVGVRFNYEPTANDSLKFGFQQTHEKRGFMIPNLKGSATYNPNWPTAAGDDLLPALTGAKLTDGSYWTKQNRNFDVSYKHRHDTGDIEFSYYKNNETRNDIIKNSMGNKIVDRTVPTDKSDSFGIKGNETLSDKHTLGYGTEYKRLRYGYGYYDYLDSSIKYSSIVPSQKINLFGLYVEDTWTMNDRWRAYFGLRYDKYNGQQDDNKLLEEASESALSPKVNFAWNNDDATTTYFSIDRVWRAPSMAEYYWWGNLYNSPNLSNKQPNPTYHKQLKPEKGMNYEIAVAHTFNPTYSSKFGVFYEDLTDYINFRHTFPFMIYNIDKAKVYGFEWENQITLNKNNSLFINYTNQHTMKDGVRANDKNNGLTDELDYSPRHKLGITYAYSEGKWQGRYNINYVSNQTESTAGVVHNIGGYAVHNASLTYSFTKNSDLAVYVDNLLDKDYAEQYNYPMNGRLFSIAYTQRF